MHEVQFNTPKDESSSKNIVVILLIGLIVILFGFFYFNSEPASTIEDEATIQEEISDAKPVVKKSAVPVTVYTKTTSDVAEVAATTGANPMQVTYTDSGFSPAVLEVVAGNSVHFVNKSNKPMWVTSEFHPTAVDQRYPEFNQGKSISTGGEYIFLFTKVGVWGYKNLNSGDHLGAISVIAQTSN